MNSTISFAIEQFLEQALTVDFYTFVVVVWGVWVVLAVLLRSQQLRIIGKKIIQVLAWSGWIGIPLLLTVTAPFIAKPTLEVLHRRDILTYILPTLTLLIGDFAARRRASRASEKVYRQLLVAMSLELRSTLKILKGNFDALKVEAAYILENRGRLENTTPPKTFVVEPNTRAIETAVIQVQTFLKRDGLLGKANFHAALVKEINHLLEMRRPLVASLSVAHPIQGSSSLSYERLRLLDDEIMGRILTTQKSLYLFLKDINSNASALPSPVSLSEVMPDTSGRVQMMRFKAKLIDS